MATTELTAGNLRGVLEGNDVVVIHFTDGVCDPCAEQAPAFLEAATRNPEVAYATCDVAAQPSLTAAFKVRAIPTVAVVREKVLVYRKAGVLSGSTLDALVSGALALDMEQVRAEAARAGRSAE